MDMPSDSGPQIPLFVDEVDKVVEFTDLAADGTAGPEANNRQPVLTDVVDRLVEFTDAPAGLPDCNETRERRALFIDGVDKVVEFADQPADGSKSGSLPAALKPGAPEQLSR